MCRLKRTTVDLLAICVLLAGVGAGLLQTVGCGGGLSVAPVTITGPTPVSITIAEFGGGGDWGHAVIHGGGAEYQQHGSELASEWGRGRECTDGNDLEHGTICGAGDGPKSGDGDRDGRIAGRSNEVGIGASDDHCADSGEYYNLAHLGDGKRWGYKAICGDGAEYQQHGGDVAGERGHGREYDNGNDLELGSVHGAGDGSEPRRQ